LYKYDTRFSLPISERLDLEDRIEYTVQEILKEWAETIPESILELYGPYLIQIRALCITRKPTCCRIYVVMNEIHCVYANEDFIDTFVIVSPNKVYIEESNYSLRSKAFPLTWSQGPQYIPHYTSLQTKVQVYKEFLESKELTYLIVVYDGQEDVKVLLSMLPPTTVTIQCMIEGEATRILDTALTSSNMYDEPLLIKHIIHRKSYDSFAKMVLAMEETHCNIVEFKSDTS